MKPKCIIYFLSSFFILLSSFYLLSMSLIDKCSLIWKHLKFFDEDLASFVAYVLDVIFKKPSPNLTLWRFLLYVFFYKLYNEDLKIRFLIHFELLFLCVVGEGSKIIFLYVNIQFFQYHLLKRLFLSYWLVSAPSVKTVTIYMGVNIYINSNK